MSEDAGRLTPGETRLTGKPTPAWTTSHVRRIWERPYVQTPIMTADQVRPVLADHDVWDMWPLARPDGATVAIAGGRLWFALAAPKRPNPDDRHDFARIRLLHEVNGEWRDGGDAFPDGFTPGSREWSGTAILRGDDEVQLFFTAAGRRGEAARSFEQRLVQSQGRLDISGARPRIVDWSPPVVSVEPDDDVYLRVTGEEGAPGMIKALRDPAYFRDPADGRSYLLFAASLKRSQSAFNGMVGIARAEDDTLKRWRLLPPLLHADGVNNELERPHAIVRDGRYYIFWCTQGRVFQPEARGPTGLYGVVGASLFGPYRALNGTGLAFANPAEEPTQAYAWWVNGEDEAWGFVDAWGLGGRSTVDAPALARSQFGGAPAPPIRLKLHDDRVSI